MIRHTLKSGMPKEPMPAIVMPAGAKMMPATSSPLNRHMASRLAEAIHRDIRRQNRSGIKMMPAKGLTTKVVNQGRIGTMTAIQPWKMPAIRGQSIRSMRDHLGLDLEVGSCRHTTSATNLTGYSCQAS